MEFTRFNIQFFLENRKGKLSLLSLSWPSPATLAAQLRPWPSWSLSLSCCSSPGPSRPSSLSPFPFPCSRHRPTPAPLRPRQESQRRDLGRHQAHHGLPLFLTHPGIQSPFLPKTFNAHRDDNSGARIPIKMVATLRGDSDDDISFYTVASTSWTYPRG
jgi:hypothetical protein